jgi:hypothetical protein
VFPASRENFASNSEISRIIVDNLEHNQPSGPNRRHRRQESISSAAGSQQGICRELPGPGAKAQLTARNAAPGFRKRCSRHSDKCRHLDAEIENEPDHDALITCGCGNFEDGDRSYRLVCASGGTATL